MCHARAPDHTPAAADAPTIGGMFVACAILSSFLAFVSIGMGSAQRNGVPPVMELLQRVHAERLATLSGSLLILGGTGLVIGLFWAPLGIAAGACLVAYYGIAAGFHVKGGDLLAQVINPLIPAAIAAVALWLRVRTR